MGTIIKASCTCGYKTEELYYGAGMADHGSVCKVPALRNGSSGLEMVNIKKKMFYPDYVFYNENILSGFPNNSRTIDFYPIKLHTEGNLCPACKDYTLSMADVGCFD
ncbi:MAG: hypothetical protein L6264_09070 [Weeksellaceae bacterium]|nr:hypothetical protein [Bacteroidota bacterium]MCG2781088.1 hypothetical protein [Weeksellaceae bacterium]